MHVAIHQSLASPSIYLFTRKKNDFASLPSDLAAELGELRFLRMSRDRTEETPSLARAMDDIVRGVISRGYHVIDWSGRE
jgi:uncharacterized protein YcgL (UPF0745 family)